MTPPVDRVPVGDRVADCRRPSRPWRSPRWLETRWCREPAAAEASDGSTVRRPPIPARIREDLAAGRIRPTREVLRPGTGPARVTSRSPAGRPW